MSECSSKSIALFYSSPRKQPGKWLPRQEASQHLVSANNCLNLSFFCLAHVWIQGAGYWVVLAMKWLLIHRRLHFVPVLCVSSVNIAQAIVPRPDHRRLVWQSYWFVLSSLAPSITGLLRQAASKHRERGRSITGESTTSFRRQPSRLGTLEENIVVVKNETLKENNQQISIINNHFIKQIPTLDTVSIQTFNNWWYDKVRTWKWPFKIWIWSAYRSPSLLSLNTLTCSLYCSFLVLTFPLNSVNKRSSLHFLFCPPILASLPS